MAKSIGCVSSGPYLSSPVAPIRHHTFGTNGNHGQTLFVLHLSQKEKLWRDHYYMHLRLSRCVDYVVPSAAQTPLFFCFKDTAVLWRASGSTSPIRNCRGRHSIRGSKSLHFSRAVWVKRNVCRAGQMGPRNGRSRSDKKCVIARNKLFIIVQSFPL